MKHLINLRGQRFARLVVIELHSKSGGEHKWLCACDCGNTKVVFGSNLRAGYTQSCGCLHKERTSAAKRQHGGAGAGQAQHTPEYKCWRGIKARCATTKDQRYGGRGITVCDEWAKSFPAFLRDMGPKPSPKHTIERMNNDGPYAPGNCKWATMLEQAANKRNSRWIMVCGARRLMSHVAYEYGFDVGDFRQRLIRHDWDGDKAVHAMLTARNRTSARRAGTSAPMAAPTSGGA